VYILECEGIIYGSGETPLAALEDAQEYVEIDDTRVTIIEHPRQHYPTGAIAIWPATEQLVAASRRDSHGLCWEWNHQANAADVIGEEG